MVHISANAANQIRRLQTEQTQHAQQTETTTTETANTLTSFLRVKVVPGGCSGMSYKLDFDHNMGDADKIFEENGTQVVVDNKSYLYIAGMTLDYEGGLNGKGFVFSNPNATKTCGCGSSFGV